VPHARSLPNIWLDRLLPGGRRRCWWATNEPPRASKFKLRQLRSWLQPQANFSWRDLTMYEAAMTKLTSDGQSIVVLIGTARS
jgi:hypothetical protein